MDTTPDVDVQKIPIQASFPLGTHASTSSQDPGGPTSFRRTRITQATILKMGHLSRSADVQAAQLKDKVPWMIEREMLTALTTFRAIIDTLTMRFKTCESQYGDISQFLTLKTDIANFKKDEDYLNSIDVTSFLKATDNMDAPSTLEIPPSTIGDVPQMMSTDESAEEIHKEKMEVLEQAMYGNCTVNGSDIAD